LIIRIRFEPESVGVVKEFLLKKRKARMKAKGDFSRLEKVTYFTTNAITINNKYINPPVSAIRFAAPLREGENPRRRKLIASRIHVSVWPQRSMKKRNPVAVVMAC